MENMSLEEEYLRIQEELTKINDSTLRNDDVEFLTIVESACERLRKCGARVNSLALFSPNDRYDDLPTSSLKYLLIPYQLAQLELKKYSDRPRHLRDARVFFGNFLQVLEAIEFLPKEDKEEAEVDESEIPPQARRNILISRAKREKEAKGRMEALVKRKLEALNRQKDEDHTDNDLDEVERELVLTELVFSANKVFSEVRMIKKEEEMLEQIAEMRARGVEPEDFKPKEPTRPQNPPYTIFKDKKGELRAQVFRPHWIPPTVSIEEAGMIDMQYAVQGGGEQSAKKEESSDEEDPDDDEVWRKKREWDVWKDANPRGSGNKMGNLG